MEAARQKALVRAAIAQRKEEEKAKEKKGASSLAPKAICKGAPKRKADGKDDHPSKKVSVTFEEKLPKISSPPKPKHGVGKGLMTTSGPVTQEPDHLLLTHKDYAIEMMESVINDKDVDLVLSKRRRSWGCQASLTLLGYVPSFLFLFIHFYA